MKQPLERLEACMAGGFLVLWLLAYSSWAFHDTSRYTTGLVMEHAAVLIGVPIALFFARRLILKIGRPPF